MTYPRGASVAAYRNVATHGGVAAADPHGLVLLLLNGALERIAGARGCIESGDILEKGRLLQRAAEIVEELRASLDMSAGGQIAANLSDLYEYVAYRVLKANLQNDVKLLNEAATVLQTIRNSWNEIPAEARVQKAGPK